MWIICNKQKKSCIILFWKSAPNSLKNAREAAGGKLVILYSKNLILYID